MLPMFPFIINIQGYGMKKKHANFMMKWLQCVISRPRGPEFKSQLDLDIFSTNETLAECSAPAEL